MCRRLSLFALLCFLNAFTIVWAQDDLVLPPEFYNEEVGDGWDMPVGLTFDTNGQGYVWEKAGRVFILTPEGKVEEPLIDISEEVMNWSDLGLVGFALDPHFQMNGYYYLLYVVDRHYRIRNPGLRSKRHD
ncbi:MAG: hypothetical protein D6772_11100 [Bacteroidetes bacterium]|nr:MAG: hypothetical protein D6772_11100 [Bacteroidota bacterium]